MADPCNARRGRLIIIQGCMFAGKTGRLICELQKAEAAGQRVAAFRHTGDNRYSVRAGLGDELVDFSATTVLLTHDGRTFPAFSVPGPTEIAARAADFAVLGIDEAQFFGSAMVDACRALVAAGKAVLVAGIHHDAWGQDFPPLPELVVVADEVITLTAPCSNCGAPAEFSQRLTPLPTGAADSGSRQILIGGIGDYEPRCRACFRPLPEPKPNY